MCAVEAKRLCGYRRINALYLCGEYTHAGCDRLPFALEKCPTCGGGLTVSRGLTRIVPYWLFGKHYECQDRVRPCHVCDPGDRSAFIIGVGAKYYPHQVDFLLEARRQGVSKRISAIPRELELGRTVIYLAHPHACESRQLIAVQQALNILEESETRQARLLDAEAVNKTPGIFAAFIPQRIEKLCWQRDYTEENIQKHKRRGIDLVPVPDGDVDHA